MITKTFCSTDVFGLSVSIVVYRPDLPRLEATLRSLTVAAEYLRASRPRWTVELTLIDNGGLRDVSSVLDELCASGVACAELTGHGNVGYGRGHNLAIAHTKMPFHLVLNPDLDIERTALATAADFIDAHPEVGLLTPWIGDELGVRQHLCRRFPTVLDLLVRGFAPQRVRQSFASRLARYEMRDQINDRDIVWDPPIVSGCFMLFRTDVLKKLGGFDQRYFLYFEDYDLSLRSHDVARVAYVPSVRVIHHGGGASRKGFAHIRMFASSAFKFYNRFGWRFW
ncbi:glycosyltransferase [Burkholderia sp. Bp9002]|nr:glycosyltransferase [Burkholderia sp. Bp9002]